MDLLAHLDAYVATADEASFSRAADRLGIAQPLLSRRIKTLEDHFGGLLFDRSRRQITTTELGVLLLPYARDVLDRAQRLRQVAETAGRVRVRAVGVPAHCAPAALARAIRAGTDRGVSLGVRELPPQERLSGLSDGSLAYALVRVPPEQGTLRVPLGVAAAPDAADLPLGGSRRALHLEELRPRRARGGRTADALPVLTLPEDHVPYHEDRLERTVARAGLPPGRFRPAGPAAAALAETLARPGAAAVRRAVRAAERGRLAAVGRPVAAPGVRGESGCGAVRYGGGAGLAGRAAGVGRGSHRRRGRR
ncbi:LysR family transcriptional regulator [Streptomyces lasalocidi]